MPPRSCGVAEADAASSELAGGVTRVSPDQADLRRDGKLASASVLHPNPPAARSEAAITRTRGGWDFNRRRRGVLRAPTDPRASSCRRGFRSPEAIWRSRRRMILPLRVLGRASVNRMSSGRASAPISLTTCARNSSRSLSSPLRPPSSVTNATTACPFISSGRPTHRRLRHRRVRDQRAFDFHRAQPMARHVDHVVDAAHDPEVAVLVATRAVAGEVAAVDLREVIASCSARGRGRSSAASRATACARSAGRPGWRRRSCRRA